MKTRNYYRPSTVTLGKKKRVVRRKSVTRFFLKIMLFLLLAMGLVAGGWWGVSKCYKLLTQASLTDWHAKTIVVCEAADSFQKSLLSLASSSQNQPFTVQDAVKLRRTIMQKYPMLKNVSVKRGLLSGKLTLCAARRRPIAKFVRPNATVEYIDADSTVYQDPSPQENASVPFVELEGHVPDKLPAEFIDLVESTLQLNKELNFTFLRMNLTNNTVKMYLPDESVIDFGSAWHLKQKAARAAKILEYSRQKYKAPFVLNFAFFEEGKVFLTQKSH